MEARQRAIVVGEAAFVGTGIVVGSPASATL